MKRPVRSPNDDHTQVRSASLPSDPLLRELAEALRERELSGGPETESERRLLERMTDEISTSAIAAPAKEARRR